MRVRDEKGEGSGDEARFSSEERVSRLFFGEMNQVPLRGPVLIDLIFAVAAVRAFVFGVKSLEREQ